MRPPALSLVIGFILLPLVTAFPQTHGIVDSVHDAGAALPRWTDIVRVSATQEGSNLLLELETADSIPHAVADSCSFRFFLNTGSPRVGGGPGPYGHADAVIEFNLRDWDGAPWCATFMLQVDETTGDVVKRSRMFDWKLKGNRFLVKLSLISLPWQHIQFGAGIYYRDGYADRAPDAGLEDLTIDRTSVCGLAHRVEGNVRLLYPDSFDSVVTRYDIPAVLHLAYRLQRELTGIVPVGGDSVVMEFNPFIGGAALEGDPILVGPYMWGRSPLWFVYFHEMGHNFCNAAVRFRQMYPLQESSRPGPLPAHLLFYEAFASLPAMYVFDRIVQDDGMKYPLRADVRSTLQRERDQIRDRFVRSWQTYKENPSFEKLNPDVVDGLFLELEKRFGWEFARRTYFCLHPEGSPLAILDEALAGDSPDLRTTRATFTAALLSASAATDLRQEFRRWGFPVDEHLFDRVHKVFSDVLGSTPAGTSK